MRILHRFNTRNIDITLIILKTENELKLKLLSEKITNLHFFGLSAALVAELHQCYHHGQTQTSDQYVEDSCYVTKRQSAGLLLVHTHKWEKKKVGTQIEVLVGCFYVDS